MFFSHPIDPLRTQIVRQFWWEKTDATSFSPTNFGGFRGDSDPLANPWPPSEDCQNLHGYRSTWRFVNPNKETPTWQFFVTFLGWLSDPFKGLSDLQQGDEKVTLNHLAWISQIGHISEFCRFIFPAKEWFLGCLWMPGASWSTGTDARRGWGPNCSYKLFCFTLARN